MIGLRNAVGMWVDPETGRPWATNMGRDRLGDERPPETLYELIDGADAGWPRCHAGTIRDPEFGTAAGACEGVATPAATFPRPHGTARAGGVGGAPRGRVPWVVELLGQGGIFRVVAAVGRWPAGEPEAFATGFLPDGAADALGRPAGLAVGADGALYVSDDKSGFIYRIARSGG